MMEQPGQGVMVHRQLWLENLENACGLAGHNYLFEWNQSDKYSSQEYCYSTFVSRAT